MDFSVSAKSLRAQKAQLCSRIAFINHGELVAEGTSADLAAQYGVSSLEDAYLELVGRKELSRAMGELGVSRA